MGLRSDRFRIRNLDAVKAKATNKVSKTAERVRRDARMMAKVNGGSLPYTPDVMSWLSRKLDKPSTKVTEADIKTLKV